jgi:hypothetical protein
MARAKRDEMQTEELTFRARVLRGSGKVRTISQEDAMEWWDVTDRTLRNWAERGLPTKDGPRGKPVYPLPDANIWAMVYKLKKRLSTNGKGPSTMTMEEARQWLVAKQAENWPGDFILVPLDHDHPMRRRQLELAARGRESCVDDGACPVRRSEAA